MTCLPCSSAIFILASSAARRVGGGEQRDAGLQVTCFVREELDHRLRSQRQVSMHETCGRDGGQCERTHFVTTRGGQHVQQLRHSLCRAQVCRRLPVCCSCVTRVIAQHVRQGIHKALQVRVQQLRLLLVLGQLRRVEREHTSASALVSPSRWHTGARTMATTRAYAPAFGAPCVSRMRCTRLCSSSASATKDALHCASSSSAGSTSGAFTSICSRSGHCIRDRGRFRMTRWTRPSSAEPARWSDTEGASFFNNQRVALFLLELSVGYSSDKGTAVYSAPCPSVARACSSSASSVVAPARPWVSSKCSTWWECLWAS